MALIQRAEASVKGGGPTAACSGNLASAHPALTEFLTMQAWDDGKVRVTGTIMLVAEQGRWKAWLHDRDAKRSGWVSALDLDGLMYVVETALTDNAVDWRADKR